MNPHTPRLANSLVELSQLAQQLPEVRNLSLDRLYKSSDSLLGLVWWTTVKHTHMCRQLGRDEAMTWNGPMCIYWSLQSQFLSPSFVDFVASSSPNSHNTKNTTKQDTLTWKKTTGLCVTSVITFWWWPEMQFSAPRIRRPEDATTSYVQPS